MRRFFPSLAVVANLLLLDQAVKAVAVRVLKGAPPVRVADFLNLAYVENRGCAWGMLQGHVWPLAAFSALAFALLLWKRRSVFPAGWPGFVAETFVYAGIFGNMIDRVRCGFVVDMFDFHWGASHFPCFNVADACITVAAAILVATSMFAPGARPWRRRGRAVPAAADSREVCDEKRGD